MKHQRDIFFIINIIFLILFGLTKLHCQVYSKLLEQKKTWNILHWTCGYGPCDSHTYVYSIEGDTLLNDMLYYEIEGHLLREDTVQRKVYEWDKYLFEDQLLYDFNLSKGDSIELYGRYDHIMVVDSVYTKFINNHPRKCIAFKQLMGFNEEWIEGIGSNFGIVYPGFYLTLIDAGYELLCVFQGDSLIYQNAESCYISDVSVEDKIFDEPKIYIAENPVRLIFTGLKSHNTTIQIFDIKGIMVDQIVIEGESQCSIQMSKLEPGLYVYKVLDNINIRGKFIILK